MRFSIDEAMAPVDEVLAAQGMPDRERLPKRVAALLDPAAELLARLAEPRGVLADISAPDFEEVYGGEGRNAPETPLERIYPLAAGLALFAVTLGDPVGARISRLFAEQNAALGYMLDAFASVSADRLADLMGKHYLRLIHPRPGVPADAAVLPYSPGYCGWDITAQRQLFAYLQPERIGITLTESCLMQPLKSVSGVLVAGLPAIHRFRPKFSFCEECRTHDCGERMASV